MYTCMHVGTHTHTRAHTHTHTHAHAHAHTHTHTEATYNFCKISEVRHTHTISEEIRFGSSKNMTSRMTLHRPTVKFTKKKIAFEEFVVG